MFDSRVRVVNRKMYDKSLGLLYLLRCGQTRQDKELSQSGPKFFGHHAEDKRNGRNRTACMSIGL